MAGRWRDPAAFRADPTAAPAARPSRRQSVALIAVLVLVAGTVAALSYLLQPDRARAFDLFHGSVFLEDTLAPVSVDLASGKPTVRLIDANVQVGAKNAADLSVVPVDGGTLLLNSRTGEFNMVDATGFVIKKAAGVPLPQRAGSTGAVGIASGGLAYIEQTGPTGTSVYLVGPTTVQTAQNANATVKPRAFRSMTEPSSSATGMAASANGQLWLLVGSGQAHTIRRLSPPPNSSAGATLTSSDHGSVTGAAAIATATTASGTSAVGVASADRIRVFPHGTKTGTTVRFAALPGTDVVLPASNADGRLSYLLHSAKGWSTVSVGADGTGLRGPTPLSGIAGTARLTAPAASRDSLYTMDTVSGRIVRINDRGETRAIPHVTTYPLVTKNGQPQEPADFGDGYVIARGSRVIFDSPSHLDALVLFTDNSHQPLTIEKSDAVSVNASGGAEALTKSHTVNPGKPPPGGSKASPAPANPVNNKIDCRRVTQKPHIPTIVQAQAGSRSVLLQWTYPVLDPQDCEPTTYVLKVSALSNGAPSPPGSVTVQGQTSVNLTGLFPSTQYEVTVTAYINGQGTSSNPPFRFTTGKEGPAAPTRVTAVSPAGGNWNVTWSSCGSLQHGCVPTASWKVIPQFCDGLGLSGAPAPIIVTGDPTAVTQPPAQLKGGDALLGRGLRFQVEGTGEDGTTGTPSNPTPCVYSWNRPVATGIHVQASTPPHTTDTGATSTNVTVRFDDGAVHDLGGVGGQLTYKLLDSSGSVVTTRGPTTATSVTLGGIHAGQHYSVQVTAAPPRHADAAVTLAPVPVQAAIADWPTPSVNAGISQYNGATGATLSVSFDFPAGTDRHGETFDLTDKSFLNCSAGTNGPTQLSQSNIVPGQTMTFSVDRFASRGDCSVTLQLSQHGSTETNPPLYGSANSNTATSSTFTIKDPFSGTTADDFKAEWSGGQGNPQILVTYTGSDQFAFSANWNISASTGGGADCGSTTGNPPPATIGDSDSEQKKLEACIENGGTITVSINYTYFLKPQSFNIAVSGTAPQPVDPGRIDFTASWDGNQPAVDVTFDFGGQDPSQMQPLKWTETVTASTQPSGVSDCGNDIQNPGNGAVSVLVNLATCPPTDDKGNKATYTIRITFTDPNYGKTFDKVHTVSGVPPN